VGEIETVKSTGLKQRVHVSGSYLAHLHSGAYDPTIGMIGLGMAQARMVTAVFTVAMLYASVCSATCAIGACPTEVQHSRGHDCDQSSSDRSTGPTHNGSESPDCSAHKHPSVFLEKAAGASQFQAHNVVHVKAFEPLVHFPHEILVSSGSFEVPDTGPPGALKLPLYQQISLLRI